MTGDAPDARAIVELQDVSVTRSGRSILGGVSWTVRDGERWAVLGPNGSGKTTLISIVATYLWPSRGSVTILGQRIGHVDVRQLRRGIAITSAAIAANIPPQLSAREVVLAGATGALAPWWDVQSAEAIVRAGELLDLVGCAVLADRPFELLSSGERQRVQIARALMLDPALLLLDEPAAGLDLGARETLARLLARLNDDRRLEGIVMVTHHVEEIPEGTTHALVLAGGRTIASGPIEDVVTSGVLSRAFGLPLAVHRHGRRFSARAEHHAG